MDTNCDSKKLPAVLQALHNNLNYLSTHLDEYSSDNKQSEFIVAYTSRRAQEVPPIFTMIPDLIRQDIRGETYEAYQEYVTMYKSCGYIPYLMKLIILMYDMYRYEIFKNDILAKQLVSLVLTLHYMSHSKQGGGWAQWFKSPGDVYRDQYKSYNSQKKKSVQKKDQLRNSLRRTWFILVEKGLTLLNKYNPAIVMKDFESVENQILPANLPGSLANIDSLHNNKIGNDGLNPNSASNHMRVTNTLILKNEIDRLKNIAETLVDKYPDLNSLQGSYNRDNGLLAQATKLLETLDTERDRRERERIITKIQKFIAEAEYRINIMQKEAAAHARHEAAVAKAMAEAEEGAAAEGGGGGRHCHRMGTISKGRRGKSNGRHTKFRKSLKRHSMRKH
jgi:hypothetical protein